MATYYIRPDGSNSNTGTGASTGQAWQTIGKIFAAGSVVTGGDIVYIAPGTYTESILIQATSPTSEVQIIGDPLSAQFSGITPNVVKLSAYNANGTSATFSQTYLISGTSKNNYSFSNLIFESAHGTFVSGVQFLTSRYLKFNRCIFRNENVLTINTGAQLTVTAAASTPMDVTVTNCYFGPSVAYAFFFTGASQPTDTTNIQNCYFDGRATDCALLYSVTASVTNCTFVNCAAGVFQNAGSANAFITVKNCLFKRCTTAIFGTSSISGVQTYNRFISCTFESSNIPTSATSSNAGVYGVDSFESLLYGLNNLQPGTSYLNSPNRSFGITSGAPVTDLYGVTWTGTSPDAGAATYRNISTTGVYLPSERNASTITIAPASTSQSIELYLGATGLTATTSGLAAYYVRNKSTATAISLVSQTASGAWTSGGFAEISSANAPGLYRLDIPNAALASGSDEVTIIVKGASGTNGAIMTINLRKTLSQLDTTQDIGDTTLGDALNAANAGGVGKWSISGDLLYLYAADGSLTKKLRVKNLRIDV